MSEQLGRLKVNDEVFIKSRQLYGKIVRVCPDGDDEPFYSVEIQQYVRRDDLDLIDREAEQEKRRLDIAEKVARVEAGRIRMQSVSAAGGVLNWETTKEYLLAVDDLWQAAYGRESMFRPTEKK